MSKNRISSCTSDFGCYMNPFYSLDRLKDTFQSSSGIDLNPYEFNKYENFNNNEYENFNKNEYENFNISSQNCQNNCSYNCPYRRNNKQICNNKMSSYNVNLINLVLIILIIIFLIYKFRKY